MRNPIISNFGGDPYVLKDGDGYYLTPTNEEEKYGRHTFQCYYSKDLQNWSEPKTILDLRNISWADKMAWAPTMVESGGCYYFCFCAEQQIGIACCDDPMGEFKDMLDAPLIGYEEYGFQTIDPCFFKDDDGRIYLLWGQGKCYMAEMDLAPGKAEFIGGPKSISDEFYWQRSINPSNFDVTIYNEAPDLIKYKGRYLLTWSICDVRDVRYRIRYAWADNVWGPYIQPIDETHDNILIKGQGDIQCTGHAAVSEYKNELYLVYHRYVMPRQSYHRQICCDKIIFMDDVHIVAIPSK